MTDKPNDILARQLMERFLDGATTIAEEKQLYAYFRQNSGIAPDLMQYREMMNWYAALGQDTQKAAVKPFRAKLARFKWVAAAVITLIAVAIPLYRSYEQRQLLYATYEGSYIIRNGVKYTNVPSIISELQSSEKYVAEITNIYSRDIIYQEITEAIDDEDVRNIILGHFE